MVETIGDGNTSEELDETTTELEPRLLKLDDVVKPTEDDNTGVEDDERTTVEVATKVLDEELARAEELPITGVDDCWKEDDEGVLRGAELLGKD